MKEKLIDHNEAVRDAWRTLEHQREKLCEEIEKTSRLIQILEATEEVIAENERLKDELEQKQEETDTLRVQLQEKELQLGEMSKLSAGVAKKASQEEMTKAIRTFINISKRKSLDKRVHVKILVMELVDAANITLPEDLREALAHLDDEQPEGKVVNVAGDYNNIHHNGNVNNKG